MRKSLIVALAATPAFGGQHLLRDARPDRYTIALDVDLKGRHFHGSETIDFTLANALTTIVLHAADMTVRSARAGAAVARVTQDLPAETVTLEFPTALPAGHAVIEIEFEAPLGRELRGLYAADVGGHTYAFTQMEPTDARRAFPCIDEPAAKAKFSMSVTIDRDWTVISNGAVLGVDKQRGKKTFRFAETPRMSTYLVAVAIAPFAAKMTKTPAGVPVAVYALPEKIGLAQYALDAAVELLGRLEKYFGIRYPYGKLDLVAVPEFDAGAMENSGAIFFRESRLLVDPKLASEETRRDVAVVLAHEMAHQWFGNLVTMMWWDEIWLNEAFATWMETKIIADWKPEWQVWVDFQQMKREPMALDALATARPIHANAETPSEINEMFDAITYEKGASILRMLELWIGEDAFRAGVNRYMAEHREGNATAADLWRSLEKDSGKPVGKVAPTWIDQAGYPMLSLDVRERDGKTFIAVEQRRHVAREKDREKLGHAKWQVPVCLRFDAGKGSQTKCELLDGDRAEWQVADGCLNYLQPNAGQGGYYCAKVPSRWTRALTAHMARALAPEERIGFLDDQWALVTSGDLPLPEFLAMLEDFRADESRSVLQVVAARLAGIRKVFVPVEALAAYEKFVAHIFQPAFARLGWEHKPNETEETKLARGAVIGAMGHTARVAEILSEAERRAASYRKRPSSIEPTLAPTVVELAVLRGDAKLFDEYVTRMRAAHAPEERDRYQFALAEFQDPVLLRRTLETTLTEDIRQQDTSRMLARVLANPAGRTLAWHFMRDRFETIQKRTGVFGFERVIRALKNICDRKTRDEVAAFFAKNPVEEAKRGLAEAMETADLCIEMREREERRLQGWLVQRAGKL